ncbi:MAG: replication initiation protein [Campylobacterota bacterium]|nr:replication initiation protein [Campylobacterota bacterium]
MIKKEIVNKSNLLISSRYKLSATQSKIILKVVSMINNKIDTEFEYYQLPLTTFDFLTNNKNHNRLKEECSKLNKIGLEIDRGNGDILYTHWFSSIEYKRSQNIIECSIDPKLKPYLLQLQKEFKYYELYYITNMNSGYSIRIYEMLKQYQGIGKRKFLLTEMHDILQTPMTFKKEYSNFRVRVLEMAEKEINKYSDIKVSFTPIKRGRAVYEIEFNIERNDKNIIEHKIEENQLKNEDIENFEDFKVMFGKFKFNLDEFDGEFENFKLYNKNNIEKINIYNFEKWCMQKRRKATSDKVKVESGQEQKQYRWSFRKAKSVSDDIKDYLKFDLGVDYLAFYYEDKLPFKVNNINYDIKKVMHPDFNKDEFLVYVIDENNQDSKYLMEYKEEIIDV